MESNLKERVIEGTTFLVDTPNLALVEKGNKDNTISYADMEYKETHYEMTYDRSRKRPAYIGTDSSDIVTVTVPQFKEMDPEGMSAKYNVPVAELAGRTDFDLVVDVEQFRLRSAGVLPTIGLRDDIFTVDLRLGEIRHNSGVFPPIKLDNMDVSRDGEKLQFWYDTNTKGAYEVDFSMLALPQDVFLAIIPNELVLDPYHVARQYGIDGKTFLFHHPPGKDMKAEMKPAAETWLAQVVAENRRAFNKGKDNANDGNTRGRGI